MQKTKQVFYNKPGFKYGATCPNRTGDLLIHTTIIFITTKCVCSLDFLFTIALLALGTPYKVSTLRNFFPSSGLTYIISNTQSSPNQRCPLYSFPNKGAKQFKIEIAFYLFHKSVALPSELKWHIRFGDPYGNRTHVSAVKGRCLNRLTKGPFLLYTRT